PFHIYYSTDFGDSWNPATGDGTTNIWSCVATSANGTNMVVVGLDGPTQSHGVIYRSVNSGASWTKDFQTGSPLNSIASSGDGVKLVAVGEAGTFTSTNSGSSWTLQPGAPAIVAGGAVASSASGTRLVAGGSQAPQPQNKIYASSDSGVTWKVTTNS